MSEPVRARRLTDWEGQFLLRIVRRGKHGSIRVRRALIIMASASGTTVPAIARLVAADDDTARDVIHAFNRRGLAALDPQWAGGRPRLISDTDITFLVQAATTRPKKLGLPFTHWSLRKLAAYLDGSYWRSVPDPARRVRIGRERLRQILHIHHITFQRTRTWKESTDPDAEAKLDRIEAVTTQFADRCFAFDQFGPLSIRPCHGTCWAARTRPDRLPATYHRIHGIRYFHGCYSLGDDTLWGILRRRKGGGHTLSALRSIRATRPDGAPIYVILDNLSANKTPAIRAWAARNKVELCFTPTSASWADPIEAQFGPLRTFTMANSNYPNHIVLARDLQAYLRWRNANARHPDVLAAQRRERARIRSERHQRWGRPRPKAA
ncbi:MAG TPA: IS630 family transposase [Candidatus Dormibacteraeota bacterium]|nr:IS630 family transposase [Candidatus Dormibacteraeota bacterium]